MDIQDIMKKAQDLQVKMEKAQDTMKGQKINGSAAGGAVKVILTGQGKMHDIALESAKLRDVFSAEFVADIEGKFKEDVKLLSDLIIAAHNNAKDKLDGAVTEIMKSLGLSPDMFNQDTLE